MNENNLAGGSLLWKGLDQRLTEAGDARGGTPGVVVERFAHGEFRVDRGTAQEECQAPSVNYDYPRNSSTSISFTVPGIMFPH